MGHATKASGIYSQAFGHNTASKQLGQMAIGKFNADNVDALFMVGNGTSDSARSNAFEVLSDNSIKIGSTTLTETQLQALLALLG